jgi:hypothetical protein
MTIRSPMQAGLSVRHALHAAGGGVEQLVRQVGEGAGDGDLFSDHRHVPSEGFSFALPRPEKFRLPALVKRARRLSFAEGRRYFELK